MGKMLITLSTSERKVEICRKIFLFILITHLLAPRFFWNKGWNWLWWYKNADM